MRFALRLPQCHASSCTYVPEPVRVRRCPAVINVFRHAAELGAPNTAARINTRDKIISRAAYDALRAEGVPVAEVHAGTGETSVILERASDIPTTGAMTAST